MAATTLTCPTGAAPAGALLQIGSTVLMAALQLYAWIVDLPLTDLLPYFAIVGGSFWLHGTLLEVPMRAAIEAKLVKCLSWLHIGRSPGLWIWNRGTEVEPLP